MAKFRTWIGVGGSSGALTDDTLNATSTSGGTLAKQAAALTLNLNTSLVSPGIGNLIYTKLGDALDGKSVSQILGAANQVLGNNSCTASNPSRQCTGWTTSYMPAGCTYSTLNDLITDLNESWDDCTAGAFASNLRAPN